MFILGNWDFNSLINYLFYQLIFKFLIISFPIFQNHIVLFYSCLFKDQNLITHFINYNLLFINDHFNLVINMNFNNNLSILIFYENFNLIYLFKICILIFIIIPIYLSINIFIKIYL